MVESRKGKACDICGGEKKNMAKHCRECSSILVHLMHIKDAKKRKKEVLKIRKEKDGPRLYTNG